MDLEPPAASHWIDGKTPRGASNRAHFWAWLKEKGLTDQQMYTALEVEHIHDYTGSMGDAKTRVMEWVKEQAEKEHQRSKEGQ